MLSKHCSICDAGLLPPNTGFFVPPAYVSYIYHKLVAAGMQDSAINYVSLNKPNFDGYCIKCWIASHAARTMLNTYLPHDEKVSIINDHIDATIEVTGRSKFWDTIGCPSLN
jgi:hypothetical protein